MPIVTKNNRVPALMCLYQPGKFESDPRSQSWDILLTSPVAEQKKEKNKKENMVVKKNLHSHADLIIHSVGIANIYAVLKKISTV